VLGCLSEITANPLEHRRRRPAHDLAVLGPRLAGATSALIMILELGLTI
jgi:hypothetical protein